MIDISAPGLGNMMHKIQALLDRAEHPNTPLPEADSCRAKAEELMNKYRIAESELAASRLAGDASSLRPIRRDIVVCAVRSPYRHVYHSLIHFIVEHVGCRTSFAYDSHNLIARVIGYESDIRYLEMLFAGVRLTFSQTMEPKPDQRLGDAENVYALRSSGMERNRIANLLWGSSMTDGPAHGKVTKLYKAECERRGEDPKVVGRTVNAKTYRESFADGYVDRMYSRLCTMRNAAATSATGLALFGRKEAVDEAFYTEFPNLRPKPRIEMRNTEKDPCAKCAKSKRGACRDHYISYGGGRERPYSSLGASAGRRAADTADLGRTGTSRIGSLMMKSNYNDCCASVGEHHPYCEAPACHCYDAQIKQSIYDENCPRHGRDGWGWHLKEVD